MIQILLAIAVVVTRRLQVAGGESADPHVGPSGRYYKLLNPVQLPGAAKPPILSIDVNKAMAVALPTEARLLVRHISQFCQAGEFAGVGGNAGKMIGGHFVDADLR